MPPTTKVVTSVKRKGTNNPIVQRGVGGQPGNLNAVVHGFYSRHFKDVELANLSAVRADLLGEIEMMRVAARRVLEVLTDESTLAERVALLNALSVASAKIGALIRTQEFLGKESDTLAIVLAAALAEVIEAKENGEALVL